MARQALNWQALFKTETGAYEDALGLAHEVLRRAHRAGDSQTEADAANCLGTVKFSSGDYKGALRYFNQALRVRREVCDSRGVARLAPQHWPRAVQAWYLRSGTPIL